METSDVAERRQKRLKARSNVRWLKWLCTKRVLKWLIRTGMGLVALARAIQALVTLFKG